MVFRNGVRNLNSSTTYYKSFVFLYGLFLIELVRQRQTTCYCTASKSVHKDVRIYLHIVTVLQSIHASLASWECKAGRGKKKNKNRINSPRALKDFFYWRDLQTVGRSVMAQCYKAIWRENPQDRAYLKYFMDQLSIIELLCQLVKGLRMLQFAYCY